MKIECECQYSAIVAHARGGCLHSAKKERRWFLDQCQSLNHAIESACASLFPAAFDGNLVSDRLVINSHQRRIGRLVLKEAASLLENSVQEIGKSENFEDLYNKVSVIKLIRRIGPLTIYDIAERIGWYLKVYPEEVYMHAGVTKGARAMRLSSQNGKIAKAVFPPSFQKLEPMGIETLLCLYKSSLAEPKNFNPDRAGYSC